MGATNQSVKCWVKGCKETATSSFIVNALRKEAILRVVRLCDKHRLQSWKTTKRSHKLFGINIGGLLYVKAVLQSKIHSAKMGKIVFSNHVDEEVND